MQLDTKCNAIGGDHLCIRLIYKYPENAFSLHICNRERCAVSIAHHELSLIWLVYTLLSACLFDCFAHSMAVTTAAEKGEWEDLFNIHIHVNNLRCLTKLAHRMAHKGVRDAQREREKQTHTSTHNIGLALLWFGLADIFFVCCIEHPQVVVLSVISVK